MSDTGERVVRWRARALLVLTLAGVLAMHGLDATATSAHGAASARTHVHGEHVGSPAAAGATALRSETSGDDADLGLHHVAAACMFALVTVVAIGIRRALLGLGRSVSRAVADALASVVHRTRLVPRPPRPVWLRLAVITR